MIAAKHVLFRESVNVSFFREDEPPQKLRENPEIETFSLEDAPSSEKIEKAAEKLLKKMAQLSRDIQTRPHPEAQVNELKIVRRRLITLLGTHTKVNRLPLIRSVSKRSQKVYETLKHDFDMLRWNASQKLKKVDKADSVTNTVISIYHTASTEGEITQATTSALSIIMEAHQNAMELRKLLETLNHMQEEIKMEIQILSSQINHLFPQDAFQEIFSQYNQLLASIETQSSELEKAISTPKRCQEKLASALIELKNQASSSE